MDQHDATQDLQGAASSPNNAVPPLPARIARYRVDKLLGDGGFGMVYLAYDEELDRAVAVKVPHPHLVSQPDDAEAYRQEARLVASLDHSNIAPVHDVGSTDEFPCFVVSKYIDGTDLAKKLKQQRLNWPEAAELVATVAETLHYAHKQGLVHRDVKPGNILLDQTGKPFVVDFGLALREQDLGKGPRYAGTPSYMSPEQARGEGHRVDGRSDIFSLGVVLYELLVGRRPFKGDTQAELLDEITTQEPRPPRQYDDGIPKELERICLKALSKRASERYTTAKDLADDLRHFLSVSPREVTISVAVDNADTQDTQVQADTPPATPGSDSQPIRIVPKGLRSFDKHDADFFLELLPGPRDREGLPDSIRFWKTRIEEQDADKTFSVGLIYGPSGCGKSSLMKAGLLTRLASHVISVYVEATSDETESRLLRGLRKACPTLAGSLSLKDTLAVLRQGQGIPSGEKVLIVLDQFEQWLHAKKNEENTELVEALRQCDGGRAQCVVMVRDDFWMAATSFMRELEVRLVEASNSAAVDLFPVRHAERVLAAFGRAFGVLPESSGDATEEQGVFLQQAAAGLAEENKVICVRLALFAEMMKGRSWTPAVLKEVGGTTGVGVTFLEETFSASTAPPEHRFHQKAARAVLRALLPVSGTDIKGHMRSSDELLAALQASGYAGNTHDFFDLVRILDSEIRLITPTDPEGMDADDNSTSQIDAGQKYYQLTHDYLVPALRDWLTRKQRETRRGRAERRLTELSAAWNAKPETRHLPSVLEWANIAVLTPRTKRTEPQQRMMRQASRLHGARWCTTLLAILLALFALQRYISNERQENLSASTANAVDALQITSGVTVPFALRDLEQLPPDLVLDELRRRYDAAADGQRKLALTYALAELGEVDVSYLTESVVTAGSGECANIVIALGQSRDEALKSLLDAMGRAHESEDWTAKARLAFVALHLGNDGPSSDMLEFEDRPDPIQRTVVIDTLPEWQGNLVQLAELVGKTENDALRSGICLAVGSIEDVNDEVRTAWIDVLEAWYVNEMDTGTHSAAGWALRKWDLPLPPLPRGRPQTSETQRREVAQIASQDGIRQWHVNPVGLTMLRIRAGDSPPSVSEELVQITRDFFLSDREISVGLFQQFIVDADYRGEKPEKWDGADEAVSPTAEHPVQQVGWYDAVMFCNWLSHREGLQPSYVKTGEKEKGYQDKEYDAWRLLTEADGYRLPSESQWEYACRAGTTTEFGCGDDESKFGDYAVYNVNSNSHALPNGSKLCNAWGLFDMHGNVYEWCGGGEGSFRVPRGGSWFNPAGYCRSAYRYGGYPSDRNGILGFRVALVPSASQSSSEAESVGRESDQAEAEP